MLSLLDAADPGPGGTITIPSSKSASNSRNSNRTDVAARLNAGSRLNVDRHAMDMRTASSSVMSAFAAVTWLAAASAVEPTRRREACQG